MMHMNRLEIVQESCGFDYEKCYPVDIGERTTNTENTRTIFHKL